MLLSPESPVQAARMHTREPPVRSDTEVRVIALGPRTAPSKVDDCSDQIPRGDVQCPHVTCC